MLVCFLTVLPSGIATAQSPTGGIGVTTPAAPTPTTPIDPTAPPDTGGGASFGPTSGTAPLPQGPTVPGTVAKILSNGMAAAPVLAPPAVQQAIWATNSIITLPYVFGGGHNATFSGRGYDCSGTVSFALHGGSLLSKPRDSSGFMRWGQAGAGSWITIYTNPGHAYMTIAGIRLDTSKAGDPHGQDGPRWRPLLRSSRGFHVRHPVGY
jgi:cell wall-associated NlpC family hydrolase